MEIGNTNVFLKLDKSDKFFAVPVKENILNYNLEDEIKLEYKIITLF